MAAIAEIEHHQGGVFIKGLEKLVQDLEQEYENWHYLYEHGGQDPLWPDGSNLMLVRNHIINQKEKIKIFAAENDIALPEMYFKELPLEVPSDYMARGNEIRDNAIKVLELLKKDENLFFLKTNLPHLNGKQQKEISIKNIINYERGLMLAVDSNDLVSMRHWENSKRYFESFKECRKKVEKLLETDGFREDATGQLSLF